MEGISIVSLNCQGLGSSPKRRDLKKIILERKITSIFYKTLILTQNLKNNYVRSDHLCYFASFSSQSRVVAILFNNFEFKVQKLSV